MNRNLLLLLGTVLLFFLVGEGVLRVQSISTISADDHPPPQGLFCRPDPVLGWAGMPHAAGTYTFPAADDMEDMHIRMNEEGFWDRPHRRTKPPGIRRLLFLGDSFTAGYGVSMEHRFSSRVAEALPASWEVMNMGVWGYSPDQELLLLKHQGVAYDPDVVVLGLFMDDLFCTHLFSVNEGRYLKPKYRIRNGALQRVNDRLPDYRTWSLFWDFLVSRYYGLRNRLEMGGEFMRTGWLSVMDRRYAAQKMFTLPLLLISQMQDLCRTRGIELLVVVIPDLDQLSAQALNASGRSYMGIPAERLDLLLPQKVIRAYCHKSRIRHLDLLPVLGRHPDPRSLYFRKDLHWTRRGHRVAAEAIVAELL